MAAEIGTLQRGSRLEGVVTGVLSYAAFVDVGVKKDGMLHACEIRWLVGRSVHDMREWVKVGDRLTLLYLLEVDGERERFTLTTRPASDMAHTGTERACHGSRAPVGCGPRTTTCKSGGSKLATPEAPREKTQVKREAREPFPSLEPHSAVTVTMGSCAAEEGMDARPTASAVLMGVEESPPPPLPPPIEIARVTIRGVERILYAKPWKTKSMPK